MNRLTPFCWLQLALSALLALGLAVRAGAEEPAQRIVSVGGSVTEIVYALGQEHRLVARDTTSNAPAAALELPDVGYVRRLSPEGLLSVNPDLILADDGAGPPEALEVLRDSRIPLITVPMGFDRAAVRAKIETVAGALGVSEQGAALATRVDDEIAAAAQTDPVGKRVLFVLAMQGGRIMAGGRDTAADGVLALAGAENAAQGFEGYKLMTDEAVLTAAPEVILLMAGRGDLAMTDAALFGHPAIAATPAGQAGAVVRMDGMLLLGFSVRTGQAVQHLAAALRGIGG